MADTRPRVLVMGGCGFVGRNLVVYLVENDLCSQITVADKSLPVTSWLTPHQHKCFEKVKFVQSNLFREAFLKKIFHSPDLFDYVFNCAAETKSGQPPAEYEQRIFELSTNAAKYSASIKVRRYIEVSDAAVYLPKEKKPAREDAKIEPWTIVGKYKARVEENLPKIEGLNYVVVRPCFIYGPSCINYVMPRLIIGAVYKKLHEKMELLWDKDLKMNTVHVEDVVRALWHLTDHGESGSVYNLADSGDTTQGKITQFIANIFGIEYTFLGYLKSKAAEKLAMKQVCVDVNEKHLQPWSDMLKEGNIDISPLSPYIDQELLYNKDLFIDGSAITATGFQYNHPKLTGDDCRAIVNHYIELGIFPKGYLT